MGNSAIPLSGGRVGASIGIGFFGGTNAMFIAVNRAPAELHMRHWEMLAMIPLSLIALAVTLAPLAPDIFPIRAPSLVHQLTQGILHFGWVCGGVGLGLGIARLFRRDRIEK